MQRQSRPCKGPASRFGLRSVRQLRRLGMPAILLAIAACCGCGGDRPTGIPPGDAAGGVRPQARFVRRVEWAGQGRWLKADTHLHTNFSDGTHELAEVVDQAVRFGCDVIGVTDHADRELLAATPEYVQAVRAARQQHPDRIILAGLEWNVPPWDGREHATVLVPPGAEEGRILEQFKARFDDWGRDDHPAALAEEGLRWLAQQSRDGIPAPLVLYNHPNRKRLDASEFAEEFRRLRAASDRLIGFSGAPGHQRGLQADGYQGDLALIDRWDPVVAVVGGGWDTLLGQGNDAWAARAVSDFHDTESDYWPGEFAETWLYAPDRSAAGVFRALEAGTFFAAHGHLVRQVQLKVLAEGLDRPAIAGEAIEVSAGAVVQVELEFQIPGQDWEGKPNRVDEIELIGVLPSRSVVLRRVRHGRPGRRCRRKCASRLAGSCSALEDAGWCRTVPICCSTRTPSGFSRCRPQPPARDQGTPRPLRSLHRRTAGLGWQRPGGPFGERQKKAAPSLRAGGIPRHEVTRPPWVGYFLPLASGCGWRPGRLCWPARDRFPDPRRDEGTKGPRTARRWPAAAGGMSFRGGSISRSWLHS